MSVDADNDFILAGHITPANHSDTKEMEHLVRASRLRGSAYNESVG